MADFTLDSKTLTSSSSITSLAGAMDTSSLDLLEDEFAKLLDSGVTSLILDMARLEKVTSAGLGAMVNLERVLKKRGGRLVLSTPPPDIRGLIGMLGIQQALTLADTSEEARKLAAT